MCGERVRRVSEKLRTAALSARAKDADGFGNRDKRWMWGSLRWPLETGDWQQVAAAAGRCSVCWLGTFSALPETLRSSSWTFCWVTPWQAADTRPPLPFFSQLVTRHWGCHRPPGRLKTFCAVLWWYCYDGSGSGGGGEGTCGVMITYLIKYIHLSN